jgi:hypothetical protein
MIYRATWLDGRQAVLRAPDEEQARLRAVAWRKEDDSLYDGDVPDLPHSITQIQSRGPVGVLLTGWAPNSEGEKNE